MRFAPLAIAVALLVPARAAASPPAEAQPAGEARLRFAVEIRVGPAWDAAKPPNEQAYFADHSANLRRLREAGHLVLGARYGEVGLVVLSAASEAAARAMMDADPAMRHGTFRYELHELRVFYSGSLEAPAKR
jgi:uncharacterized protein YciI